MKTNNLILLFLIPIAAIIGTAFYLFDSAGVQTTDASLEFGSSPTSAQTASTPSRSHEIKNRRGADKTLAERSEKIDPQNYSSIPPMKDWEKEILTLVNNLDIEDATKVQRLLAMMPSLPHDGKVLAMEQATRLIPDTDYVRLRPTILGYAVTPELRETMLHDVLTRGDTIRMPSLVELLRHPSYPAKTEIADILSAYLDYDFGTDATKWDVAVKQWIIENPDI